MESGINEGDILYHKFVEKDPVEAAKAKAKVQYVCVCMYVCKCKCKLV